MLIFFIYQHNKNLKDLVGKLVLLNAADKIYTVGKNIQ